MTPDEESPYDGRRGTNGCISSWPAWTTPQLDSGTSFQAPCEVAERLRDDEPRLVGSSCSTGLSGYWWRSVCTSVLKKSDRELPSLE